MRGPELLLHEDIRHGTFRIGRCPFCNNDDFIINQCDTHQFYVSCSELICCAAGPTGVTAQEAVDKWNWGAKRIFRGVKPKPIMIPTTSTEAESMSANKYSVSKTKEICEKATEGPWHQALPAVVAFPEYDTCSSIEQTKSGCVIVDCCEDKDAEFIAHARTALPEANALLAECREQLSLYLLAQHSNLERFKDCPSSFVIISKSVDKLENLLERIGE